MVLPIYIKYEECVTDDNTDDGEEEDSDDSYEDPRIGKGRVNTGEEEGEKESYQIVEEVVKAGQLEKLKVEQCKVYLRKHGLRLAGNKDTLIQRIREHLDVTDGGGERKYPVSSFVVNCKGDACTGDVVLFKQIVYELFKVASKSATGPPCGTRLVAGRILKESYGARKQQHTFTIEVLWSTGEKPLPPLYQLLIKGRNLYRLNTMRRKWEDEAERQKTVSEKHARGDVARSIRETREKKELKKKLRKLERGDKKKPSSTNNTTKLPENKLDNVESHIGNVQKERHQHPKRQPLTSMDCSLPRDSPTIERLIGNVSRSDREAWEKKEHCWQLNKSPSKYNALNNMVEQAPQKPQETKPSNIQSHTGNVLKGKALHPERQTLTSMNCNLPRDPPPEQHVRGDVFRSNRETLEKKEHRNIRKCWQLKKSSSTNGAANTMEEQAPQKPPEKKPNNMQSHVLNHRQYQHPGRSNPPPGNESLNSVERASQNGSMRSPLRASSNTVEGHSQGKKLQACIYFAQGWCRNGDRCKWLHEDSRFQKN